MSHMTVPPSNQPQDGRSRTKAYRASLKGRGNVIKQIVAPDLESAELLAALAKTLHTPDYDALEHNCDQIIEWFIRRTSKCSATLPIDPANRHV
jgi:hypothetical protein